MSWAYLTHLLEEISNHSTLVGKLWFSLLVVFRIVLTVLGGESIYSDEQGAFVCNTLQPGCENMCYDAFAPLSHARFWVFQIIMITTPTILYLSFALHKIARMAHNNNNNNNNNNQSNGKKQVPTGNQDFNKENGEEDSMIHVEIEPDEEKEKEAKVQKMYTGWSHIKQGGLMKAYFIQLFVRVLLELAFLYGQYILYRFKVPAKYLCTTQPCPYTIDCFVSRPTEKTIFLLIMYGVSLICLLLTIFEILHLAISYIRDSCQTRHRIIKTNTENLVYVRHTSSPPPRYNATLQEDDDDDGHSGTEDVCNLGDFGCMAPGDEVSSQEICCHKENPSPLKQQLDLVCQRDEDSSVQSSLNVEKQEKPSSCYGKATRV